jgi:SRSO17 transposase
MAVPDRIERLLYRTLWDADSARDRLAAFVIERLGDEEGIGLLDETGFLKQGKHSVGVQRQYTGTAGKIANCQVGVFLGYVGQGGHALLDRRLYLPQSWCQDAERRRKAKVPSETPFRTKPQLAVEMLKHAWSQGVPMRWVVGDEHYGNSAALRDAVAEAGRLYVLAVASSMTVYPMHPMHGVAAGGLMRLVSEVVEGWSAEAWHRLTVAGGEKGPRVYDWACERVVETRDGEPGPQAWLLARRSVADPGKIAYYLSNAPLDTTLQQLAEIAASRYRIEQCFHEAKGETGLDHYEVRHWHSWYRHITLSMMAHAWLSSVRLTAAQKGAMITNSRT